MDGSINESIEWKDFKKTWSQEDITNIESVLKKIKTNTISAPELKCELTKQEKAWAANFAVQAFLWGCCKANI
jgi:hypothetical protein